MQFHERTDERGPYLVVEIPGNQLFFIDHKDRALVEGGRWRTHPHRRTTYVRRMPAWNSFLHREIMQTPKGLVTDHRDGNGLNCRRYNMRIATNAQNMANRITIKGNESGLRGVYRQGSAWTAIITIGHKTRHLGSFADPIEAAKVRDAAAWGAHGEFAILNFPRHENIT